MKKILINGLLLGQENTGIQYSIENLIKNLISQQDTSYDLEVLLPYGYAGSIRHLNHVKLTYVRSGSRLSRIYYEQFMLPKYLKENNFSLYHAPASILSIFSKIPTVLTIHDLTPLAFPKLCQFETVAYFRLFVALSMGRAKHIIAVSETVKQDILKRFPKIEPKKIHVVHPGINERFKKIDDTEQLSIISKKYKLPSNFLLFVGNLEPKKNLVRLIEAYATLKTKNITDYKLVIVGKKGWKYSDIFKLVKKKNLYEDVIFLGYVSEEDLPGVYNLAKLFIFPSLYEGFGIPVLEAMACGCPSIVSDRGSLPETSGGRCLRVNPYSIEEITNAIIYLISNIEFRKKNIQAGLKWSEQFTWVKSAEKTDKIYKSLIQ